MPYCINCGQAINENAFVCIYCGVLVDSKKKQENNTSNDGVSLGIIGLCFALFVPLVTWIVSGIGYSQASHADNKNGKSLNLIALIVSSASAIFYLIFSINL